MATLAFEQLHALLHSVFALAERESGLAILVDLPDERVPEEPAWLDRRRLAAEWFHTLAAERTRLPFSELMYCTYRNVGSNNNDLPERLTVARTAEEFARLPQGTELPLDRVLDSASVVLAPTQFSATAPLKLLAKQHGFRGATLPGFSRAMIPALSLDYERVHARVMELKERMDRAAGAYVTLEADGRQYDSFFDLRHRSGHASGGLMREPGMVGNLPSGEAYIVPYEGERDGDPSATAGKLPVQFGTELVVYRLERNHAVEVLTSGARAEEERVLLREEPAYGNMAEVGLGVLGEWGVEAVGSTLLDEKLGLHIAFGRSDHFDGITGPGSFRDRDRVVHIDRVYVPSTQPMVRVLEVAFGYPGGTREIIMRDGRYVV